MENQEIIICDECQAVNYFTPEIKKEPIMERKFEKALNIVLEEMGKVDTGMCVAVYWDDMNAGNAIVMFMEYPAYVTMHAVMKDLHARLSNRMGHPVSLCHNHPTDESVLINSGEVDSSVYYSDECCMRSTLGCYERWVNTGRGEGYRPELRSLFFAAECIAEGLNKTPKYVLKMIDWDQDPQAQMIELLINYHA